MSEYLLGIDNGNTISKAAIFDLSKVAKSR